MRQGKFNVMYSADSTEHLDVYYVANDVAENEINEAVYAVFCVVAAAVLDRSTCFISGDRTASEIAGCLGGRFVKALIPLTDTHHTMAPSVQITAGDRFSCVLPTEDVFEYMAEWEGVMSLAPKNYHRFSCECKQESFSREPLKPYTRRHQAKATNPYSAACEARRINKKFEVIGPMSEALGSEGMKKALAVLSAIKAIQKLHGNDVKELAGKLLRRKLWKDYGHCEPLERRKAWLKEEGERLRSNGEEKGSRYKKLKEEFDSINSRIPTLSEPMQYGEQDFQCAPEAWKKVDNDYVKELLSYFNKVLADNRKPEWPAKDDMVQLKNQAAAPKKWQGRLKVLGVRGTLDYYQDRINWYAEVCTTKGRYDAMTREIGWFVPWTEPEKQKKVKKEDVRGKKKERPQTSAVTHPISIEDRLRTALRKQFAMAA